MACMLGESTMKDARTDASGLEIRKGRVKPKVIKEGAMAKGLEALATLESSDIAAKPVQATARTFVQEAIETILRLRAKGVPLLRIYNDSRKAAGLRIGYQTFAGYVSEISREKGLRQVKAKAEAGPAARHQPGPEPAPMAVEASSSDWHCDRCESDSTRHESTKKPGTFFWKCPECKTFYADIDGTITNQKLGG